jgi:hypothetical protein
MRVSYDNCSQCYIGEAEKGARRDTYVQYIVYLHITDSRHKMIQSD